MTIEASSLHLCLSCQCSFPHFLPRLPQSRFVAHYLFLESPDFNAYGWRRVFEDMGMSTSCGDVFICGDCILLEKISNQSLTSDIKPKKKFDIYISGLISLSTRLFKENRLKTNP